MDVTKSHRFTAIMTLFIALIALLLMMTNSQKTNYSWANAGGTSALKQNNFKGSDKWSKFRHDMKIKWSGLGMTDGSGKIGGNVAAKNRFGNYLRRKGQTMNPQTAAQMVVRGIFGAMSSMWRGLTDVERAAWSSTAATVSLTDQFGDSYHPTGFAFFKSTNQNLDTIGQSAIDEPELLESGPSSLVIVATDPAMDLSDASIKGINFDIENPVSNVGSLSVVVEATPPVSAGRSEGSVKNLFRIIEAGVNNIAPGATLSFVALDAKLDAIYAAFVARFGAPLVGQKAFYRISVINDTTGQKTLCYGFATNVVA